MTHFLAIKWADHNNAQHTTNSPTNNVILHLYFENSDSQVSKSHVADAVCTVKLTKILVNTIP